MTSYLREVFSTRFSANPVEQQRRLVDAFRSARMVSRLSHWAPGDSIPDGVFVLVGVMVGWNTYDQELTVALDEAIAEGRAGDDVVKVFAADDLTSTEEVEVIFPGLRSGAQSPYVGVWQNGRLRLVDGGASAMAFLSDRYGLKLR